MHVKVLIVPKICTVIKKASAHTQFFTKVTPESKCDEIVLTITLFK